jgi:hypothetical protein
LYTREAEHSTKIRRVGTQLQAYNAGDLRAMHAAKFTASGRHARAVIALAAVLAAVSLAAQQAASPSITTRDLLAGLQNRGDG